MNATDSMDSPPEKLPAGKRDSKPAADNTGPTLNDRRLKEDPPGTESPPLPLTPAQQPDPYVPTKKPETE